MKNARFTVIAPNATTSYEVQWDFIGEGYSGDFDPEDPDDRELWRLDLYNISRDEFVEGASWCTQLPLNVTDDAILHRVGIWIAERSSEVLRDPDDHIGRLWDALSHIDESWLESKERFTELLDKQLSLR